MFEIEEWQSVSRQEDDLVRSLFGEVETKLSKKQRRKERHYENDTRHTGHAGCARGTEDYETEKGEKLVEKYQNPSGKKSKKRKTRAVGLLDGHETELCRKIKKLEKESFAPEMEVPRDKVQGEEEGSEKLAKPKSPERKKKKRKSSVSGNKAGEPKGDEHANHLETAKRDKLIASDSVTKKSKEGKSKKVKQKQAREERGIHVDNEAEIKLDFLVKKLEKSTQKKTKKMKEIKENISMVDEDKQVQAKHSTLRNELISSSKSGFQEKMMRKLEASRFRWINEQLYTTKGCEAMDMFSDDPGLFSIYHRGFKAQVHQWPVNPVDVIIRWLKERPSSLVVADFGCGEATIAQKIPNEVHSFDLVAVNEQVTACDMSKVPLPDSSVDVAVFCLSLMGTNLVDYLQEAHRVLRAGGTLKIAEVVSRIEDTDGFVSSLSKLGFQAQETDTSNKMFVIFELLKGGTAKQKSLKTGLKGLQLKPCIYKRR